MSVKKHYLSILNVWRWIRVPFVVIAFLGLLWRLHYSENVRIAEAKSRLSTSQAETNLSALSINAPDSTTPPAAEGEGLEDFQATAYCITGITKSGVPVAPGHVAADPKVIPLGSVIYVESALMGGVYQVTDTGRLIKGKIIDIFIPSYEKSMEFGRRKVKVKVLRHGFENDRVGSK
jgi:3D (Asp-Asp-Asp) domain-containing protein